MKRLFIAISLMLPLFSSCDKGYDTPTVQDVCAGIVDKNFKNYCYSNFDKNGDGVVSKEEAEAVTSINIQSKNLTSVEGIKVFTKVQNLSITETSITTLDLSKNTSLVSVSIKDCTYLSTVTLGSLTDLETLIITGTKITSLDVTKLVNLKTLNCSKNSITALDITKNTNLEHLDCSLNSITTLDISKNVLLKTIECYMPSLKEILVNKNQYSAEFFKTLLELEGVAINMAA